jgi:hypothetical protein
VASDPDQAEVQELLDLIGDDVVKLGDEMLRALLPATAVLAGELAPARPQPLLALARARALAELAESELRARPEVLGQVAATLRQSGPEAEASRRVAAAISTSVQWPDAEVRTQDNIAYQERESWWVVYVRNGSDDAVTDVDVQVLGSGNRAFSFHIGDVSPGRQWYVLPRDSGLYGGSTMPRTKISFVSHRRRFLSSEGNIEQLIGGSSLPVTFPLPESRVVAERVRVTVDRPDQEVRSEDQLDRSENWWVVYLSVEGDLPVHRVQVQLKGKQGRGLRIIFPPVEPGRRRWWVLRPDSGFEVDAPPPEAEVEFDALGRRWLRSGASLIRISR